MIKMQIVENTGANLDSAFVKVMRTGNLRTSMSRQTHRQTDWMDELVTANK